MDRTLRLAGRTVDLDTGAIAEGGSLRPMELRLLLYLAEHPGRVVSRQELLTEVWGWAESARTNTVNTTWYRLRTAIEADPETPRHLVTVTGRGVMLVGLDAAVLPTTNVRPLGEVAIGRDDELAFLQGSDARLVTITGPGGVGKTRLALEHVQASCGLPGGAWLVEIAGTGSETAIVDRVVAALGLASQDPERMGRALAIRGPMLVVLDEAEEVVGPVSACVRAWTEAAPELRLVVTSRVALGIPDEQRLPLLPLSLPSEPGGPRGPASELFLRRVRIADPAFRPDDQEEALDDVLRQLDGLPLAIELAAPHVAALGADAVRTALRAGDPLFTSLHDRPERHRSLHAMVAWSWATLPEECRGAIRQLLAFRRSFSLEAARAVAPEAAITVLRELGLVVPVRIGAGPRFRVLETVRAIAGEPDPDAVERHVRWYLALSRRRFEETDGFVPDHLPDAIEVDELLQAAAGVLDRSALPGAAELLAYAAAIGSRCGRRGDAVAMVKDALRRGAAPRARVRLLHYLSSSQEWDASFAALETLPGEAVAAGLMEVAIDAELIGVMRWFVVGDRHRTRDGVARVAALARELPASSPLAAWADGCRAHTAAMIAEDTDTLPLLEHAVARMRQPEDRARIRNDIADQLDVLNRTDEAVRVLGAALRDLPRPNWLRATVQGHLAETLARAGRHAEASEQLAMAVGIARHMATTVGMAILDRNRAETLRLAGRLDEADAAARSAAEQARDLGMRRYEAAARRVLALVHADRADADAPALLCDAFEETLALEWSMPATSLLGALADLGADADLLDRVDRALAMPQVGFEASRLALIRAEWLRARGRALEAVPLLAEVAGRAPEPLRLRVRLALAAIAAEHGDDRSARALCSEPWVPADGRWTRIHRARCLMALGRTEAAAREVAPVAWSLRERVLKRALSEVVRATGCS